MYMIRSAALALGLAVCATGVSARTPSATEILLGQSVDLSGPASPRQKLLKQAADAYLQSVNEKGGVNGRKIRVITMMGRGGKLVR